MHHAVLITFSFPVTLFHLISYALSLQHITQQAVSHYRRFFVFFFIENASELIWCGFKVQQAVFYLL